MPEAGSSAPDAPFLMADLAGVPGTECPCGISHRAFQRKDNKACTLHLVKVSKDAKAHYHKRLTEVYYLLSGEGHIELNGSPHPVKPGTAVLIRPGTRHRALIGSEPMEILNVVIPPFDPGDEWFD